MQQIPSSEANSFSGASFSTSTAFPLFTDAMVMKMLAICELSNGISPHQTSVLLSLKLSTLNTTGNILMKVTLRRIRIAIVFVEKH
jgi:hypothetical protein